MFVDFRYVARFGDLPTPPWPRWEAPLVPWRGNSLLLFWVTFNGRELLIADWVTAGLKFYRNGVIWEEVSRPSIGITGGLTTYTTILGPTSFITCSLKSPTTTWSKLWVKPFVWVPCLICSENILEPDCMFLFGFYRLMLQNQRLGNTTGSRRNQVLFHSTWLGLWSRAWRRTTTSATWVMLFITKLILSSVALPFIISEHGDLQCCLSDKNSLWSPIEWAANVSNSFLLD